LAESLTRPVAPITKQKKEGGRRRIRVGGKKWEEGGKNK